jgi:type IV secretory pathway VirB10-like protein
MKKFYATIAVTLVLALAACSEEKSEVQETPPATEQENNAGKSALQEAPTATTQDEQSSKAEPPQVADEAPAPAAAPTAADKAPPAGEDALANDALVEGTDYHATGDIPCAMGADQPTGTCPFGVKREGNGSGMVTVTKPDGRTRTIFFKDGNATGADTSEADPGEFSAEKKDDVSIVRIGDERYEIFDAVIFGG